MKKDVSATQTSMEKQQLTQYLTPGEFMNSDHPDVIKYARANAGDSTDLQEKAKRLYLAVRDGFRYDAYQLDFSKKAMQASDLLQRDYGYCVEKSNLFAACCRAEGIPARLGFANVRNHLGTEKLEKKLKTDVLVFHGYAEVYLDGKWIKATPVFNKELCDKLGVAALDFDGENDNIFQAHSKTGNLFMEYLHDYGVFADVPYELFMSELRKHYAHLTTEIMDLQQINIRS